jgi:hypothetical protein
MKNILSFLLCFICGSICHSQSVFDYTKHLEQYWNYRYALLGDNIDPEYYRWESGFIEIGEGPGYSIPMTFRKRIMWNVAMTPNRFTEYNNYFNPYNPAGMCNNQGIYPNSSLSPPILQKDAGIVSWNDAPTPLGTYLQVLATEYELLRREGSPWKSNTLYEIKKALDAVERLDLYAEERFYHDASRGSLNGYFYRDDVPKDFASIGCKFGCTPSIVSPGVASPKPYPFDFNNFQYVISAGSCDNEGSGSDCDPKGKLSSLSHFNHGTYDEESQDQLIKLLMGLVFIERYVHEDGLDDRARNNTHRMIKYLQGSDGLYVLRRPDGTAVCRGPIATLYSTGFLNIQSIWGWGPEPIGIPTAVSNKFIWNNTQRFVFDPPAMIGKIPPLNPFSIELQSELFMMGDDYSKALFPFPRFARRPLLVGMSNGYTKQIPCINGPLGYAYDITLEMMAASLFNYPSYTPKKWVENMLDKESYKGYYSNETSKWSESIFPCEHATRFYAIPKEDCVEPDTAELAYKERNGLDYMLMFNLYSLTYGKPVLDLADDQTYFAYLPLYDRTIVKTFPYISIKSEPSGLVANNLNIEAANSQTLSCKINSGGRVNFTAPHILLTPGFYAAAGSVVNIKNERMSCTANFIKDNSKKKKK